MYFIQLPRYNTQQYLEYLDIVPELLYKIHRANYSNSFEREYFTLGGCAGLEYPGYLEYMSIVPG